jgi:hypothetical protein
VKYDRNRERFQKVVTHPEIPRVNLSAEPRVIKCQQIRPQDFGTSRDSGDEDADQQRERTAHLAWLLKYP